MQTKLFLFCFWCPNFGGGGNKPIGTKSQVSTRKILMAPLMGTSAPLHPPVCRSPKKGAKGTAHCWDV